MCLATVYSNKDEGRETLLKNVISVRMVDGSWVFTDIMGKSLAVEGELEKIDLMENFISIRANA
jgi:predicted RNA-binding protein